MIEGHLGQGSGGGHSGRIGEIEQDWLRGGGQGGHWWKWKYCLNEE